MQKYETIEKGIRNNDVKSLRAAIGSICCVSRDFSDGEFEDVVKYVEKQGIKLKDDQLFGRPTISSQKKEFSEEDFARAVFELKKNFCDERIEDVKTIGRALYGDKKEEKVQPKSVEIKVKPVSKEKKQNSNSKETSHPNFKSHQQNKKNRTMIGLVAVLIVILLIVVLAER